MNEPASSVITRARSLRVQLLLVSSDPGDEPAGNRSAHASSTIFASTSARASREAPGPASAASGANRDHSDDRRHVLFAGDIHAGLAVTPESPFPGRESSSRKIGARGVKDGELLLNEMAVTLDTLVPALRLMAGGQDRRIIVAVAGNHSEANRLTTSYLVSSGIPCAVAYLGERPRNQDTMRVR